MNKKAKPIVNPQDIAKLLASDPSIARIHSEYGAPPNWERPQGFESLSLIILEQQVSLASAQAHYQKLKQYIAEFTPHNILLLSDEEMRNCFISRQKSSYLRALAQAIVNRELIIENLGGCDELQVRNQLQKIKGIGNWTCDIYLMFCMQYKDIIPLGDIAILNSIKKIYQLNDKASILLYAQAYWSPYRSLASYYLWHHYLSSRRK